MRIFLDTANMDEIRQGVRWGVVHGITTNPSLVAKEGANFRDRVLEICDIVDGPVSAEVTATDAEGMIGQGEDISTWHPNVVVKIPTIPEGLTAIKALTDRPDPVTINATLIFSPNQGLLAALAGATYVSPFLGRLDDISHDGMAVVSDLAQIFRVQGIRSNILAASLRAPLHVVRAAKCGAHVVTLPFAVLEQMMKHPLTDIGLERFLADWEASQAEAILQQAR